MLFSSLTFIWFFLPAAMLLHAFTGKTKWKNITLLLISLFFYSWGEPVYLPLLLWILFISYEAGRLLDPSESDGSFNAENVSRRRRWILVSAVLCDFLILGYYKYFDFLSELLLSLTGREIFSPRGGALPLGISFYTFQAVSYVVDIYRGTPAKKSRVDAALCICLFPQILSGPIIKYKEIAPQISDSEKSGFSVRNFSSGQAYGIRRFVYGLAKKVLIADVFGQTADRIFLLPPGELGTLTAWFAVLLYTLHLYYDFSGYSDMAIGLGKMFGFHYAENFYYPYCSKSVSEFWRRWHISLSSWFREYLYFPLGGNRKGLFCTCRNLFIVFFATGLWHGASMNFIFWGMYHGCFMMAERFWLGEKLKKYPRISHLYTMLVVMTGWVFFRSDTFETALTLLKTMFKPRRGLWDFRIFANGKILFLTVFALLFCGLIQSLFPKLTEHLYDENHTSLWDIGIMAALLFLSTIALVSSTYSAFIYFKF